MRGHSFASNLCGLRLAVRLRMVIEVLRRIQSGLFLVVLLAWAATPALASTLCLATGTITRASTDCARPCAHCKHGPPAAPHVKNDCCVIQQVPSQPLAEPSRRQPQLQAPLALPALPAAPVPGPHFVGAIPVAIVPAPSPPLQLNRPLLR